MEDDGYVVAAAIINQIQVPEYKFASWKLEAGDSEVKVIHTLVVDPFEKKKGYGKAFSTQKHITSSADCSRHPHWQMHLKEVPRRVEIR